MISAWTSPDAPANLASASRIGRSSEPMSGRTASQKSRRRPQRTSTSLVASPSKRREIVPSDGSPLE